MYPNLTFVSPAPMFRTLPPLRSTHRLHRLPRAQLSNSRPSPYILPIPNLPDPAPCHILDLHTPLPYHQAWSLQHSLVEKLKDDPTHPDTLILLEHPPVYTLGTASTLDHVLFDAEELKRGQKVEHSDQPLLVRTERGGEVTYHGPGQLVAYPILNLNRHKKDLHWYLRSLEEVVIHMLSKHYALTAGRKKGLTGVWVDDVKVCAIGLKVTKWITMHGLALNISTDLAPYKAIVPCGISQHQVSSLHLLCPHQQVHVQHAKRHLIDSFNHIFGPYSLINQSTI